MEAIEECRLIAAIAKKFNCDALLDFAIDALCEINRSHTAAAKHAYQRVRSTTLLCFRLVRIEQARR